MESILTLELKRYNPENEGVFFGLELQKVKFSKEAAECISNMFDAKDANIHSDDYFKELKKKLPTIEDDPPKPLKDKGS